ERNEEWREQDGWNQTWRDPRTLRPNRLNAGGSVNPVADSMPTNALAASPPPPRREQEPRVQHRRKRAGHASPDSSLWPCGADRLAAGLGGRGGRLERRVGARADGPGDRALARGP